MLVRKRGNGMVTSEFLDFSQELQEAFDECLVENEKLSTELASNKQSMRKLEEKASDVDNIQDLRAIEVAKHQTELSKTKTSFLTRSLCSSTARIIYEQLKSTQFILKTP